MNNWPTRITAILNWMSKVSQACIGVTFLYFVIGSENSHHPLNQSILKHKLIDIWSLEFSSASHDLQVFTEHSHFLHVTSSYFETGLSNDFGVEVYDTEMKCVLCWKKKSMMRLENCVFWRKLCSDTLASDERRRQARESIPRLLTTPDLMLHSLCRRQN